MPVSLVAQIHRNVHELMGKGFIPTTLKVGWRQYGTLHRFLSPEPDGPRPTTVFGMSIVLVPAEDHLEVVCHDRRM